MPLMQQKVGAALIKNNPKVICQNMKIYENTSNHCFMENFPSVMKKLFVKYKYFENTSVSLFYFFNKKKKKMQNVDNFEVIHHF